MKKYYEWINKWLKKNRVRGNCEKAVKDMKIAFPELEIKVGMIQVLDTDYEVRYVNHWWLEKNGKIIDPTYSQYIDVYSYNPWQPGSMVVVGKCKYCGENITQNIDSLKYYPDINFCSKACENGYISYLLVDKYTQNVV